MAEQYDVVCVQRDRRYRAPRVEALQDTQRGGPVDEPAEYVDDEDEELRGQRVALSEASTMPNWGARVAIEQHPSAC